MDVEDLLKSNVAMLDVLKSHSDAILRIPVPKEIALSNGYEFGLWISILALLFTGCMLG